MNLVSQKKKWSELNQGLVLVLVLWLEVFTLYINAPVSVMPQGWEDEQALQILTKFFFGVRISIIDNRLSEFSAFPRIHTHFCYKIQCQNSPSQDQ